MAQRSGAFIDGVKNQVGDATQMGVDALGGTYTTEKFAADISALWINGAALVGALWGFPGPTTPPPGEPAAPDRPRAVARKARHAKGARK